MIVRRPSIARVTMWPSIGSRPEAYRGVGRRRWCRVARSWDSDMPHAIRVRLPNKTLARSSTAGGTVSGSEDSFSIVEWPVRGTPLVSCRFVPSLRDAGAVTVRHEVSPGHSVARHPY